MDYWLFCVWANNKKDRENWSLSGTKFPFVHVYNTINSQGAAKTSYDFQKIMEHETDCEDRFIASNVECRMIIIKEHNSRNERKRYHWFLLVYVCLYQSNTVQQQ